MAKHLVESKLFDGWLTLDELGGASKEVAILSLRKENTKGNPGKRLRMSIINRAELTALAFALLDITDLMSPESVNATSQVFGTRFAEPWPVNETFMKMANTDQRRRDVAQRHRRINERMPILHRAQRLLEECDDKVAETLDFVMSVAKHTGDLPLRTNVTATEEEDRLSEEDFYP